MKGVIVTLTGPSCAGKSTLEKHLKKAGFASIVSTTTRPVRNGEKNGEHYHFVTNGEFRRMIADGEFVENVVFQGNLYGASVVEFEKQFATGKPVVIVCEPNGRKQIQEFGATHGWKVFRVFVDNPAEVIAERFLKRFFCEVGPNKPMSDIIETYSRRLGAMITVENEWRQEAKKFDLYDLSLQRFDAENAKEVVAYIRWIVDLLNEDLGRETSAAA